MRIVDLATFLKMPEGTVYQKYEPCFFGPINIKGDSCGARDWFDHGGIDQPDFEEATDSGAWGDCCDAMERGESKALYFGCGARDGLFNDEQLFGVWEAADVRGLIEVLQGTLTQGEPPDA